MRTQRRVGLSTATILLWLASAGQPAAGCVADCNTNGSVAVDEFIAAVNIALGTRPLTACSGADPNHNGIVEINELVAGLTAMVSGCPTGPRPVLDVAEAAATPGQTASVDISFANPVGPPIAGIELQLSWDPAKIGNPTCEPGPSATSASKTVTLPNSPPPGMTKILIFGVLSVASIPDGIVATCHFPVASSTPNGTYRLTGHDLHLTDPNANAVGGQLKSGSISVGGA